ncbi:hypothetical protein MNBD_PLANCTO03-64 [hydrothermal vent metagenome]|uniref:Outer membrane lipoprotein-sorting protein n=1 Tax=hydrothermal vent metagenome TaxID=652676 RepID=A0A3B1DQX4_9ZZZZ
MYTHARAAIVLVFFLAAFVAPAAAVPAAAAPDRQPEAETLPDAESLFENYIAAIGGREALAKHRNRILHASYRVLATDDIQILTISLESPNKLHAELEAPALGSTIRATNGTTAWGINLTGSTFILNGREKDELLDGAYFQGEADYKDHYASIKTVGTATIDNKPAIRVDFVTHSGIKGAVYFDPETHLVSARQVFPADNTGTSTLVTVSDYKDFEGVLIPTLQRQRVGDTLDPVVEISFNWIEINADTLPDFDPPADATTNTEP